jgi:hypothetical protein
MSDALTPADIAAAREHSPGRVYPLHRATVMTCPPCHGECNQGRYCPAHAPAEACSGIGEDYETPTRASVRLFVALVLLFSVAFYGLLVWAGSAAWPKLLALFA